MCNEIQVSEHPCHIETNVDERTDVVPGNVESTISADAHLVVLNLEMSHNRCINTTHFCNTTTPYYIHVVQLYSI